ncbi:G patch domain and ankyrin repeat-containing protein 1-like [Patiria miniata]|uniref:G-patch domain-containing protein n=1 Tax=Patiria miniata TaxID=46514 RepID=A0A914AUG0_PATMI|nr:G patch domain and ankyrin repeat-containing protein 1-like [Patiria miniata]XP_038067149.1 G patch domain and ankyrin repeat-containing protein 1-like [Patiria miniata]XP_038067150.1 G patch domain and ankyrin repeat-containing protein 1-like [Patiria miniata]XP_038067151.1 G patch domain and ankyrin repeat-containing protein 1-like [Patiria miniata]
MDSSTPSMTVNHQRLRLPFQGIRFLKSTLKDGRSFEEQSPQEFAGEGSTVVAGREARDFYESVISMKCSADTSCPSSSGQSNSEKSDLQSFRERRKTSASKSSRPAGSHRQSERVHMRNVNNFLRYAQEGDVKGLSSLLEEGLVGMDVVDGFNWTALMCASYNGHSDAVQFLLRKWASWERHRDKSGRTALDLAKMAGHVDIVRMLQGHHLTPEHQQEERASRKKQEKSFWCEVCKVEFRESSRREHRSCTVHLFNCQHKPPSTLYYIPESNVGFQMMMQDGWDKEQGLGPDGAGLKFPVKTVLKRDRKGLGAADKKDEAAKARITHFKPYDVKAVKRPAQPKEKKMRTTTLDKKARQKLKKNERNWERDFRQSFNML